MEQNYLWRELPLRLTFFHVKMGINILCDRDRRSAPRFYWDSGGSGGNCQIPVRPLCGSIRDPFAAGLVREQKGAIVGAPRIVRDASRVVKASVALRALFSNECERE